MNEIAVTVAGFMVLLAGPFIRVSPALRSNRDAEVVAAVFRHQLRQMEGSQFVLFLSMEGRDPAPEVLTLLPKTERLPRVISEAVRGTPHRTAVILDRRTNAAGMVLTVRRPRWLVADRAYVEGVITAGGTSGSFRVYHVVRRGQHWVVERHVEVGVS